jgi:hypothetical protein
MVGDTEGRMRHVRGTNFERPLRMFRAVVAASAMCRVDLLDKFG